MSPFGPPLAIALVAIGAACWRLYSQRQFAAITRGFIADGEAGVDLQPRLDHLHRLNRVDRQVDLLTFLVLGVALGWLLASL